MNHLQATELYAVIFNETRDWTKEMEDANGTIRMLQTQVFHCGPCNSTLEAAYVAAVTHAVRILRREI